MASQRLVQGKLGMVENITPARQRAQLGAVRAGLNAFKFSEISDVDQQFRRGHAKREKRRQGLAAGDHFDVVVGKVRQCFRQRLRAHVIECCRLHRIYPAPCATPSRVMRCERPTSIMDIP